VADSALVQHDRDLFSVEHQLSWSGVRIPVRMTILRLGNGQLILHSPVPISSQLERALAALGSVGFIVVPQAHGKFAAEAARQFPNAELISAPFPSRSQRALPIDGELRDEPPASWRGDVDSLLVRGFRLNEVALLQRASKTLILTDLCFNIHRSPSRATRTFLRANGAWRRFGPSHMIRLFFVSDRPALRESVQSILQWDFDRVIPGHGDVLEREAKASLRDAWLS